MTAGLAADKLLHLPPIRPLDEEVEPRKTREAVFKHIGSVQLPDLLLEVDAATHFSEALLAPQACSSAGRSISAASLTSSCR